jgi:hypothetical protein
VSRRIQADLRSQYVLGFTPGSAQKPRSFHKLQVKVTLPNLKVRAQDRYFAQ